MGRSINQNRIRDKMKDLEKQIEELKTDSEYIYESIRRDTFYDFGSCLEDFEEFSNKTLELLEEYKESSRWRKVEEELPENQDIVLVRTDLGCVTTAYCHGKASGWIVYGDEAYKKFGAIKEWKLIV